MNIENCDQMAEVFKVAAGVIIENSKFLVEKRRDDEDIDPGLVCMPGGHVDPGETLEQAIVREMKEELGITVNEFEFFNSGFYTASNGELEHVHYFIIKKYTGKIVSHEAASVYWESDVNNLSIEFERNIISKLNL